MAIVRAPHLADAVKTGSDPNLVLARATGNTGLRTAPGPAPIYRPWTPPRPSTPPVRPPPPGAVRPNYRISPWDQQTPAERMQNTLNTHRQLERDSRVEIGETENENTVAGTTAIEVKRKRRRRRNCCNPIKFRTEWLTPGNSIANKRDPRLNFTRQDFAVLDRSRVFTVRGFNYQYFVTGDDSEYRASGGGTNQWADGEESHRCWLIEAKYHASFASAMRARGLDPAEFARSQGLGSLADSLAPPAPPGSSGPSVSAPPAPPPPPGQDAQFERYGKVVNAPDPPAQDCWNIGLRVVVSQRGLPLYVYKDRMLRYNITGRIEWRPAPGPED